MTGRAMVERTGHGNDGKGRLGQDKGMTRAGTGGHRRACDGLGCEGRMRTGVE